MLTISLHAILIHAPHGLYAGEAEWGNTFEVDVDINVTAQAGKKWPFVDYTIINSTVRGVFSHTVPLLEDLVQAIHTQLKEIFPAARQVRVAVRKLHPPMDGSLGYAQVSFEG